MGDQIPGPSSLIAFPTPNARQGGTRIFSSINSTPSYHSNHSYPSSQIAGQSASGNTNTSLDSMIASLSNNPLSNQQPTSSGQGSNGDVYDNLRLGVFPVPGGRPPQANSGSLPQDYIQRFFADNNATLPPANPPVSNETFPIQADTSAKIDEWDFGTFLSNMPRVGEDASRHGMFTELIKLRTKSLELQIAEARRKEKEAELELERWKEASTRRMEESTRNGSVSQPQAGTNGMGQMDFNPFESIPTDETVGPAIDFPTFVTDQEQSQLGAIDQSTTGDMSMSMQNQGVMDNPPTPMTLLDLESMMHDNNLDGLFSWLPDFGQQQAQPDLQPQQQLPTPMLDQGQMLPPSTTSSMNSINGIDPSNLFVNHFPTAFEGGYDMTTATPTITAQQITSPLKRSASPTSDNDTTSPAFKRSKRTTEKKIVVEKHATCPGCEKSIAKIMFRALRTHMPEDISVDLRCKDCTGTSGLDQVDGAAVGGHIGTVEIRKRLRGTLEVEDEEKDALGKRQFCDVCQRVVAVGRLVGGEKDSLSSIAEIICASCDSKYQRCTDCGGGGGPRVGIGKWRMKQVFPLGRKTCSLSHNRLGDRPRELGVHVTPTDFNPSQLKEVLTRTRGLWNEKTLARLAVPEMLEIDLPPGVLNPVRDYSDVEDIITRNWPTREAMICAKGVDGSRFKRLLGLIWAHPRSRRAVRTVDLEEEEYSRTSETVGEADMSTVLDNVKRTNIVIPPGSELVGMWGGEWDMRHGALLITTLIPFEGADGEDNTALSVGEMITKVQSLQHAINQERTVQAQRQGKQPDLLPQCEHLWVVSGGTMPLVRERVADVLIKKRSFVHVEEYLTRHPEFAHALNARPLGLHPDLHRPINAGAGKDGKEEEEIEARPLILVRWLGRDFDSQKVREIKLQEFGGKSKTKKKTKGR